MSTETFTRHQVTFGCDPEFFFERKGEIVGSDTVLDPDKGMPVGKPNGAKNGSILDGESKFICDGVQVEMNPRPDTCRARLCNEISFCFAKLKDKVDADKALKINFSPLVKLGTAEMEKLSDKAKVFGCSPSRSAESKGESTIAVDAAVYPYRSAGGHIHIGKWTEATAKAFKNPDRLADIMDIIVGNTCVLVDRDEGNIIRRQVYGKAGEFRLPSYGFEYRTLSNFWLRAYPLASFVLNLSRLAVNVIANSKITHNYERKLKSLVDMAKVREAINTNDYDLALANFNAISDFLVGLVDDDFAYGDYPFNKDRMVLFRHFITRGLDYWFKEEPMAHWAALPDCHTGGWETFLNTKVREDMRV